MGLELTEQQFNSLTEPERVALERFLRGNESPIATSTSAKLFELFCHGDTCRTIQKLNPMFSYGQILHARVRDNWDEQRDLYLKDLFEGTRKRLIQTKAESAEFLSDVLKAVHTLDGDKIKRFLQTKDPKELEGVRILPSSGKSYKELVEALGKIVGDDEGGITVTMTGAPAATGGTVSVEVKKNQLPASEAHATILQVLAARKKA